jgi:hypothetical protein
LFTKSFVYSISFSAIFFPSSKPSRVSSGKRGQLQCGIVFVAAPSGSLNQRGKDRNAK